MKGGKKRVRTRDYNINVPSGQDVLVFVMPFNSSMGTFFL